VRDARIGPDELVLDLGAGTGVLTAELGRHAGKVCAIEIDPELVTRLRERFGNSPEVEIVHGDVLRVPLPRVPFRVLANIPFNLTSAIMRRLLDDPAPALTRADLIVAADVAWKRARVSPSTALGAYWGAWWEFAFIRRLDATAFAPPPGVDAALLRIERRREPLVPPTDAVAYRALVMAAFDSRAPIRRTLRGRLSPLEVKRLAAELGFAPDAPPWELDQHQWAGVHRFVR
jgi:16S rRNA A1518/A1519 N6-dimethyltransferase RsmA/KsgA/DIM1 with predicted DNA glycosylase/AP lyase activity